MKDSFKKKMLDRHPAKVKRDRFVIDLLVSDDFPSIEARPTEDGGVIDRFKAAVAELPREIGVVRPFDVDAFSGSDKNTVYVAPDGCDENSGSCDSPLASLNEALERVKGAYGARIVLRGGDYTLTDTVQIGAEHSGREDSPLIITAEEGEKPSLTTSCTLPASAFKPVCEGDRLRRLKAEVRGKVLVADLTSLGITDYGFVGAGGATLVLNGREQPLCRYPNEGEKLFDVKGIVCAGYSEEEERETGPWEISVPHERCFDWQWNESIYVFGGLGFEWYRLYARVAAFNRGTMTMKGDGKFADYPVREDFNNTYFFVNVFEELDAPGEWYLDRDAGKLYFYPPKELSEDDDIRFINRTAPIIRCCGAENVIIDGLEIGKCVNTAVGAYDCRQVLFQRCHISGTSGTAMSSDSAVELRGGYKCGIVDSVVENFTCRGAIVSGGDRDTLVPSRNFIQNCKFVNAGCRFGVYTSGVGNIVSHNYFHNTTLIDVGSNEGIVEYNIFEGGDVETHDSGVIYVAGGGCSACGNHYRYNYMFDFVMADYGIYFDDLSRGMYAYGNVVVGNGTIDGGRNWISGGRSFNHHNGGEHCYADNVSIDAGYFAFGGDISYWNDQKRWDDLSPGIHGTAQSMATDRYLGRNPTYRDYTRAVFEFFEDKKDPCYKALDGKAERRLRCPYFNHYENNLIFRANRPYKLDNGIETATGLETNFITNEDPGFVDLENRNYSLRPDAEALKRMKGFNPPPFERMGPVCD